MGIITLDYYIYVFMITGLMGENEFTFSTVFPINVQCMSSWKHSSRFVKVERVGKVGTSYCTRDRASNLTDSLGADECFQLNMY